MAPCLRQQALGRRNLSCKPYRGPVLCGPAPQRPKPHRERLLTDLASDQGLAIHDKQIERKLKELLGEPSHRGGGSRGRRNKDVEVEAVGVLINGVKHAASGDEVALWLRSAIREGLAGPKLVTAALDRLADLHKHRLDRQRKEAEPALMAACQLAVEQGMVCLHAADLWMLVAMARTPYWLFYTLPKEQQGAITDAFLRALDSASRSAAARGDGNGGPSAITAPAPASGAEEQLQQSLANFIWATFSSASWCQQMSGEQRAALLAHVRQQPAGGAVQHDASLLVALVRLESFCGATAVAPFLEDGTLALIVGRIMARLEALDAQQCQNTLLSVATLRYHLDPAQLLLLLDRLLAVVGGGGRPANVIAKTFKAVALLHHSAPQKYGAVLAAPALEGLCRQFASLAADPAHRGEWLGEWDCMLRACAEMRYNPPVGDDGDGRHLFDAVLLPRLPELAQQLTPFDAAHALLGVGAYYGAPAPGGKLAPPLRPYRKHLAYMALRAREKLALFVEKRNTWDVCTEQHVREVVGAFAALGA